LSERVNEKGQLYGNVINIWGENTPTFWVNEKGQLYGNVINIWGENTPTFWEDDKTLKTLLQ